MSADAFLEKLAGVGSVVIAAEDGRLLDSAGTTPQAASVAAATAAIARGLGRLGAALHLEASDRLSFTIQGDAIARVACRQRGTVAVLEVDPGRATEDLETSLRGLEMVAEARKPKFTGDLELFGVPALLEFLRGGRRTGTLVCTSDLGSGTVVLRRGKVIGATAPAAGRVATARGSGVDEVRQALLTATRKAVRELATWTDGRFEFDPAGIVEPPVPGADIELDAQALLLSIFATDDEQSRAP